MTATPNPALPVRWSHSALKDYETCARKFHETRVLKLYPRQETEQTIYGTQLHEQCEWYIKEDRPLDRGFEFLQPILDTLKAMPGRKLCEHEMAVRGDLSPCSFGDPDYWARGIADLIIVNDDNLTARVYDYKAGSDRYPDTDQLTLMSLMVFKHFPHIRRVTSGLLFVTRNRVVKHQVDRAQENALWWRYRERVARIEASHENGVWNPTQSGLCKKYCPCTGCEFQGIR